MNMKITISYEKEQRFMSKDKEYKRIPLAIDELDNISGGAGYNEQ